jgi:Flp pilus assembly protein TadG
MKACQKTSGFLGKLRSAASDQKGVAAIEFALIVPIMIGLYLMLHETANGLRASRKVTMTARVLADLASRPATLDGAGRSDIFGVAPTLIQPFDSKLVSMRLTSVCFDATGQGKVDWSQVSGSGYAPYGRSASVSVPAGMGVPNSSVVLAEVQYPYKPAVGYNITGTIMLSDSLHMRPRSSSSVQDPANAGSAPMCSST